MEPLIIDIGDILSVNYKRHGYTQNYKIESLNDNIVVGISDDYIQRFIYSDENERWEFEYNHEIYDTEIKHLISPSPQINFVFLVILFPKHPRYINTNFVSPSTRVFYSRNEACDYLKHISQVSYNGRCDEKNVAKCENSDLYLYLESLIKYSDELQEFHTDLDFYNYIPCTALLSEKHIEIKRVPYRQVMIKSSGSSFKEI